ncbi:Uncharacterised protein [Stenotrophomonas maltophilia]|nr:Uncharacterised protein [Stenotrophomonas maltophilia]
MKKDTEASFTSERLAFHSTLLRKILTLDSEGNPSNSDKDSGPSKRIGKHIAHN